MRTDQSSGGMSPNELEDEGDEGGNVRLKAGASAQVATVEAYPKLHVTWLIHSMASPASTERRSSGPAGAFSLVVLLPFPHLPHGSASRSGLRAHANSVHQVL